MRDGSGRYRSGDGHDDDYWPDETYGPADDYGPESQDHVPDGQYATYGPRGGLPGPARPRGTGDIPGAGPATRSVNGRDQGRRVNSGPQPPMPEWQDRYRGTGPGGPGGPGADEPLPGPQADLGGSPAAAPARPYGRILIFTLLDDQVADFDRLAEQAAEEVRIGEPDTLVYVIHLVPNAPMQRIFYEIYRDRAAFDSHEAQPYMQRFVAERRSCVLATNVIELRLKYAKVAPLLNPQASAPALPPVPVARGQLPAGPPPRPQPSPAGPRGLPGAPGPQGTQRLQPLPPVRPPRPEQRWPDQQQRPDQQRPDQQRPDQQRPDQQRPDQRQAPPAGRRYQG